MERNEKKAVIGVSFFVTLFLIICLMYQYNDHFKEIEVIEEGFFYLEHGGCLQRASLITDLKIFESYCDWYLNNNSLPEEGVKLSVLNSISICPFDQVHINRIDTLKNGFVFAHAYQSLARGESTREVRGFVLYDYLKKEPPDDSMIFCDNYLDLSWEAVYGVGSSPNPDKNTFSKCLTKTRR